jgi:two-component system OmpR family response regulator
MPQRACAVQRLAFPKRPILVVDDDRDMVALLRDLLEQAGFEADGVGSGAEAMSAVARRDYALVLLDLRLDGEDGLTLARRLRQACSVPIMMLSGQCDETDRVLLLELVADDFLVKPFNLRELVARVRAVLRRRGAPIDPNPWQAAATAHPGVGTSTRVPGESPGRRLRFDRWTLDLHRRELRSAAGTLCPLTQAEFRLLEAFARHPQRVWTRDDLLLHTRSLDTEVFDRTIDVTILRLRRKIEPDPRRPRYIRTERGLGYVFVAQVEAVEA